MQHFIQNLTEIISLQVSGRKNITELCVLRTTDLSSFHSREGRKDFPKIVVLLVAAGKWLSCRSSCFEFSVEKKTRRRNNDRSSLWIAQKSFTGQYVYHARCDFMIFIPVASRPSPHWVFPSRSSIELIAAGAQLLPSNA